VDKNIHINTVRSNAGITLKAISEYNSENKEVIETIDDTFFLKGKDKEKILALLYLLAFGKNDDVVQRYRNEVGLHKASYDSTSEDIKQYNTMLVTALVYNPTFYAMAVNYYGAINARYTIGEPKSKRNILIFFRENTKVIAVAASILVVFSLIFLSRTLSPKIETPAFVSQGHDVEVFKPSYDSDYSIMKPGSADTEFQDSPILQEVTNTENFNITTQTRITKQFINSFSDNLLMIISNTLTIIGNTSFNFPLARAGTRGSSNNTNIDYSEKITEFTKAFEDDREDYSALLARSHAYYEIRRYQNALDDLQTITEMGIKNLEGIYYVMGLCHYHLRQYDKAIEAFEKVKAIHPGFADVDEILEQLYQRK
jgi:tetratricopeptide (TPR) repeat protein